MRVAVGQCTDIGKVRKRNEDTLVVRRVGAAGPLFLVVADGIGGGRRGDEASSAAARVIEERVAPALAGGGDDPASETISALLRGALDEANAAVRELADQRTGKPGMGTTCVCAVLWGGQCVIRHVGDSRAYLLSERRLSQVTQDHARVHEFRRGGERGRPETGRPELRLVMTRALGLDRTVESDQRRLDLKDGDTLLLCTDGLTGMLADADIEAILAAAPDPQSAADRLVAEANARGGIDNTTAIVVRCGDFVPYEPSRPAADASPGRQPSAARDEWADEDGGEEEEPRPVPRPAPRQSPPRRRSSPRVHPGYLVVALVAGVLLGYLLRGIAAPPSPEPEGPALTSGGQSQ